MSYIATWINEQLQAAEAQLVIEDTLINLKTRQALLDRYMPVKMYDSREFLAYVMDKIRTVASIISYGAEVPTAQPLGKFTKLTGELFKAGLSFDYPEEKQWAMKYAMELAAIKNVTVQSQMLADGSEVRGTNNTLADYLFGTVADMARALVDLLYLLSWQAVSYGVVNYTDPRTNTTLQLDYRDVNATYGYAPHGKQAHFPPDYTASPKAWDQYPTATGLDDLENDIEKFIDDIGRPPSVIVMSRSLRRHLMNQEFTRRAFATISNTAANVIVDNVGLVGPEMLTRIMERRDMPPIVIMDEMYHVEDEAKNTTQRRFLNQDRYVFLTENMGEQAMGPTLESGNDTPGAYVLTREVTKFPPRDATQGVATMLPVIPNPKLLFSRRVV